MAIGNIAASTSINDLSHQTQPQHQTKDLVSSNMAEVPLAKVKLSPAALSLSEREQKLANNTQNSTQVSTQVEAKEDEASGGVKSFAYGALGMDHPDKVDQAEDDSYTAGQFLKAAATVGSVIALFV
ncbi:hypothetical protein [Shewanella woodyi]|uniref:Uncharacterized protein n=1 Tax=Shewanella woodyi (strain ATCC 51908 / MS32) TaxID=392500 RepID=B1KE38_SHEWM|nr:hypothetical protein [Shewanella woodyi]ACA85024.1 conserved hypothetical protein [Shewanella woodyi ATCC 51908]